MSKKIFDTMMAYDDSIIIKAARELGLQPAVDGDGKLTGSKEALVRTMMGEECGECKKALEVKSGVEPGKVFDMPCAGCNK